MNLIECWSSKDRLKGRLAEWIIRRGIVCSDRSQSNYYTGVRIVIVDWYGHTWEIIQVDGMACGINKKK